MSFMRNMFRSTFGGGSKNYRNPADSAMPYLNQVAGIGRQYNEPFIEQGKKSGNVLNAQYDQMLNPSNYMDRLLNGYGLSPVAQQPQQEVPSVAPASRPSGPITSMSQLPAFTRIGGAPGAPQQSMQNSPDMKYQWNRPDNFAESGQGNSGLPQDIRQMSENPQKYLDEILNSYKPSSGYNFKQQEMLKAAANSAAAGGFRGTQADQQNSASLVQGLLGDDMQQFLNNVLGIKGAGEGGKQQYLQNLLGIHGSGIAGHQGLQNQGFNAALNLSDYLGNNLGNQAGLAYQGHAQKNQYEQELTGQLLGAISAGAGAGMGGGFGGGGQGFGGAGLGSTLGSQAGGGYNQPFSIPRSGPRNRYALSGQGMPRGY